jgi:hypothetical protein
MPCRRKAEGRAPGKEPRLLRQSGVLI